MKKLLIISSAALTMLSGCATDLTSAITALSDAAVTGALTYEQIAALKAAAKVEQGSMEAPEPGIVDPADCPPGTPPPVVVPQKPVVPISGMASMVILGSEACSHTRKLLALNPEAIIEAQYSWIDVVYADRASNSAVYQKYRPVEGFLFPLIRCFRADGSFAGDFVARRMAIEAITAKVAELLPEK